MRKITALKSLFVTAAALASALGLAGSASALGGWTVTGFPPPPAVVTGVSSNTVLTDPSTGTQLKCTSSGITVTGMNGSGQSGAGILRITAAWWSNCSGPLGITFSVTAQNLPWSFNAMGYNATSDLVTGTITGIEAHISGVGCTTDVRGATSASPATVNATYANPTHTLSALGPGTDLHAYNVSGSCVGLINNGDPLTFSGGYVLNAPVTIRPDL